MEVFVEARELKIISFHFLMYVITVVTLAGND